MANINKQNRERIKEVQQMQNDLKARKGKSLDKPDPIRPIKLPNASVKLKSGRMSSTGPNFQNIPKQKVVERPPLVLEPGMPGFNAFSRETKKIPK